MKHVKDILLEKRNFKDFIKYNKIFNKILKSKRTISLEEKETKVYEEFGKFYLYIKTWGIFSKDFFDFIKETFGDINYIITPMNDNQVSIEFCIPKSYLEELDLEIISNKYNL